MRTLSGFPAKPLSQPLGFFVRGFPFNEGYTPIQSSRGDLGFGQHRGQSLFMAGTPENAVRRDPEGTE
ncbi:MAG: hypothetical protein ACRERV_16275 [Methylococcales bacterium]